MPEIGLQYVGDVSLGQWLPGEPAASHNEHDPELRKAKIASGLYARGPRVDLPAEPEAAEAEPSAGWPVRSPDWWREHVQQPRAADASPTRPAKPARSKSKRGAGKVSRSAPKTREPAETPAGDAPRPVEPVETLSAPVAFPPEPAPDSAPPDDPPEHEEPERPAKED